MFTGPVGPVEVFFYWPEAVFGNFYWPGAIGSPLASSLVYMTDFANDGPMFLVPLSLSHPSSPVLGMKRYGKRIIPRVLSVAGP